MTQLIFRRIDARRWAFQRILALTFLIAWWSLGRQVLGLIGSRGLLPIGEYVTALHARLDVGFLQFPTLFLWMQSDALIELGCWLGGGTAVLALFGVFPRVLLGLSGLLYLSYAVACRAFLGFQWDNLLLECSLLAVLLPLRVRVEGVTNPLLPEGVNPRHSFALWRMPRKATPGARVRVFFRDGNWVFFLGKVLLFKLYFQSGLAKYQSHLGDWIDGSAMSFYYETAPIPTPLAWFAHALPAGWHSVESWLTLGFELLCPFLIFAPRSARWFVLAVFSAFQLFNITTANYGFFAYLALGLGVFLLDPVDAERARRLVVKVFLLTRFRRLTAWVRWLKHRVRQRLSALNAPVRATLGSLSHPLEGPRARWEKWTSLPVVPVVCFVSILGVSLDNGLRRFVSPSAKIPGIAAVTTVLLPFRVLNTYHLFAHITRERIEPEFQTLHGDTWLTHDLKYKPGPLDRSPPFVAPHQPRLDFRLWFYGLSHRGRPPEYVITLLRRLCSDTDAVADFFEQPLRAEAQAARVVFWQYHFTTPKERAETGQVWRRSNVGSPRSLRCMP